MTFQILTVLGLQKDRGVKELDQRCLLLNSIQTKSCSTQENCCNELITDYISVARERERKRGEGAREIECEKEETVRKREREK